METKIITGKDLEQAAKLLREDQVVAFPTETVYGLGANALSERAIKKIFEAKSRPGDNPLIVHVSSIPMLKRLLAPDGIPEIYLTAIHKYWPGPLTILVKKPECIPNIVTAGQSTVGIRIPSHPVARELIDACGFPLAAPSANISGRPSPTLAAHVYNDLKGIIPMILDGGPCQSGIESTVLDALRPVPSILRPGGITAENLKEIYCNLIIYRKDFSDATLEIAPTTPGMKYRHYTPNVPVLLVELKNGVDSQRLKIKQEYEKRIKTSKVGVLTVTEESFAIQFYLGSNKAEIARNVFSALREMEDLGVDVIIVQGVEDSGEGLAIMNRIRKAASEIY